MKKRLLALIISFAVVTSGIPAYAAEPEVGKAGAGYAEAGSFFDDLDEESEELSPEDDQSKKDSSAEGASEGEGSGEEGSAKEKEASEEGSEEAEEEAEESSEEASEESSEEAADAEGAAEEKALSKEDQWLLDHGMTKNAAGFYEYVDEDGVLWEFDPEDPEFFKYFNDDHEEEIGLSDMAEGSGSSLFSVGEERPDPYVGTLTGYKYGYPPYLKKTDPKQRAMIRNGMDISYYQGNISVANFQTLKNTYGVDFVYLRAGYRGWGSSGSLNVDKSFANNVKNAYQAGLWVGAYYFSQAITQDEAVAEANHCLNIISSYSGNIALPVIIDYEYSGDPGRLKAANLSRQEHTDIVNAFCSRMRSAGYLTGVYANKSMLESDMVASDIGEDNYVWLAQYPKASGGVYTPGYTGRVNAWQYTSSFTGFGAKGLKLMASENLDLDFWYGAFPGEVFTVPTSFDANGGSGEMADIEKESGQSIVLPDCEYIRPGCVFVQWNTEADGSGTAYNAGDSYTVKEEGNQLYAIWGCTVTFDSNGGSAVESQVVDVDGLVEKPDDPAKEDHDFKGWYKDSTCQTPWNFEAGKATRNITLYALWEKQEDKSWGSLEDEDNAEIMEYARSKYATPSDIPDAYWLYGVTDMPFTGKAVTLEGLKVFYGKRQLTAGTDYTIRYQNNVKTGKASVTVTGKGNYQGSCVENFNITPLNIDGRITAKNISASYTGRPIKGTTTVTYRNDSGNEVTLKAGSDFTFVYPHTDPKAADYDSTAFVGDKYEDRDYEVLIVGKGNYEGESSFTQTILNAGGERIPVSKLAVGAIKPMTLSYDQDGNLVSAKPEPVVRDGKETLVKDAADGYELEYINNTAPGTASVYIIGKGKYTGSRRVDFKINPYAMAQVKAYKTGTVTPFVCDDSQIFTSGALTQSGFELRYGVTKTSDGALLVRGRDYEVTTTGNVNAGNKKAVMTFTGKGIYSGTYKLSFSIKAAPFVVDKAQNPALTIYMNHNVPYAKAGAKPDIDIVYAGSAGDYDLKEGRDYTLRLVNNTAVNDGSNPRKVPAVYITGKGNFTGTLVATYKITSADISRVSMTASDIVYANKANICRPAIALTDLNGKKLVQGVDYEKDIRYTYADPATGAVRTVTSTDIIPLGTEVTAYVTGRGNYRGTKSAEFRFVSASLASAVVKIKDMPYTGKEVTITKEDFISIKVGKADLTAEDYDIVPGTYVNNVNTGTAKVTICGKGDYGGTKVVTFRISKKVIKK